MREGERDREKEGNDREGERGREREEEEGGREGGRRWSTLISSFSFLLPGGIRMILFKLSALELLD